MFVAETSSLSKVDDFVLQLLQELGIETPPVDPMAIAQRLGLEIRRNRDQRERGRLTRNRRPVIVVRPEPRPERYCWTVAHEIGEYLMPGLIETVDSDAAIDADSREELANEFAKRLLAPTAWLAPFQNEREYDLFDLKRRFSTASFEVVTLQLLALERPLATTVCDNDRLTRRRSNLPVRPPRVYAFERQAQRLAHASREPATQSHDCVFATAWPIHEPGWKREIILTYFDLE